MVNRNDDLNRAAQFLPFDAMKGLSEEIQSRIERRSRIEKIELSEESKEEISAVLCRIRRGTEIKLKYYKNGHYLLEEGIVTKTNQVYHWLRVGDSQIYYDDIYEICIVAD